MIGNVIWHGQKGINPLSQIWMTLTHWTSYKPRAAQSQDCTDSLQHGLFTLCILLTSASVYAVSVVLSVCGPGFLLLSLSVSLRLHLAEAMAAVLVKRFVYPIRMMKRPFISALPPARRWQGLYLDKPLKHTARHETAPRKDVRRQYTFSLTNTHRS